MLKEKGAIGILEVKGFVSLIDSLDTMIKASNVKILGHQKIGAGIISVIIYGDIGSVRVAIDAGVEKGRSTNCKDIKATIIANPSEDIAKFFFSETEMDQNLK